MYDESELVSERQKNNNVLVSREITILRSNWNYKRAVKYFVIYSGSLIKKNKKKNENVYIRYLYFVSNRRSLTKRFILS